jgi:hypothetical protein
MAKLNWDLLNGDNFDLLSGDNFEFLANRVEGVAQVGGLPSRGYPINGIPLYGIPLYGPGPQGHGGKAKRKRKIITKMRIS